MKWPLRRWAASSPGKMSPPPFHSNLCHATDSVSEKPPFLSSSTQNIASRVGGDFFAVACVAAASTSPIKFVGFVYFDRWRRRNRRRRRLRRRVHVRAKGQIREPDCQRRLTRSIAVPSISRECKLRREGV